LQLGDGETLEGNPVVVFVDAAGTSNPTNSNTGTISRVWLSGGTHGGRAVFTVAVTTSGGRTLERAFGVDVVDNAIATDPTEELYLETMSLPVLKQARTDVWNAIMGAASGERIKEVWRDGRRVVCENMSPKELRAMLDLIDGLISAQEIATGVSSTPRRTAIGLAYG
jgi:hypothetical protein